MAALKEIRVPLTVAGLFVILLIYITVGEALEMVLPVVIWFIIGGGSIVGLIYLATFCISRIGQTKTLHIQMKATQAIAEADALKAHSEARKARILVITAPKDHQLVIEDPDQDSHFRQLHRDPKTHVNYKHEEPTSLELQIFQAYHSKPANDIPMVIDQPPNTDILSQYSVDWIQSLVYPAPHANYCGATRSGKTMLANHHIARIKQMHPDTVFHLFNPKAHASRNPFIIEPAYSHVNQAEEAFVRFIEIMEERRTDPNFSNASHKIVFVIDELDYIKDMCGVGVSRMVNPLLKVGAELNINVILIGQSPLTGDTGLSQSTFYQMCRVAIWREGERLLKSAPMDRKSKAPMMAQYEQLKSLAPQYELQTGNKLRYCLVIPMSGNPSVQVIPFLSDPESIQQKALPVMQPPIGSYDLKVCQAWYQTYKIQSPSANKMHKRLTGGNVNINSRQREIYRSTLKKYGIQPTFF